MPWGSRSRSLRGSSPRPVVSGGLGDARFLGVAPARFRPDADLLLDADQDGAGLGVQVEGGTPPRPGSELRVVGAVEPAADLVRADVRVGQDPADRGPGYRQAASAQVTGDHGLGPAGLPVRPDRGGGRDDREPGAGPWVSRRPGQRLSKIPRMPWRANRPRHWRTVFSVQPRSRAIFASGSPAAAAITILAPSTSRCGIVPALMICRSFRSHLMVIRTGTAGGPGIWLSSRIMLVSRKDSASRARREGKRERRPRGERRPGAGDTGTHAYRPSASRRTLREPWTTTRPSPTLSCRNHHPVVRLARLHGRLGRPGDDTDEEILLPHRVPRRRRLGLRPL
jgi:hypothetical protein